MNEKKILTALIAGVIIIIIVLGLVGNCNPPQVADNTTTYIANKSFIEFKYYDSLDKKHDRLQHQYDSLIRVTADKRIATQPQLHNALQLVTNRTDKIKNGFVNGFWASDETTGLYNEVDSLKNEVINLNGVVFHYENVTDSLINYYEARTTAADGAAVQKEQLYYQLRTNFNEVVAIQSNTNKNIKQLNKQLRWQKTKSHVLIGVAAAAVAYAVIKN